MTNKEKLKKQIIYRSSHRGFKEMDLLLGSFVKQYINDFKESELKDLVKILSIEDEIIYKWYLDKKANNSIKKTRVSMMLKNFRV
tara:strand:+ start:3359 stop:3613 length:255 start_codon:yes stop_codon:yes gene_type:complete